MSDMKLTKAQGRYLRHLAKHGPVEWWPVMRHQPTIDRCMGAGWVNLEGGCASQGAFEKRTYRLTDAGRDALRGGGE